MSIVALIFLTIWLCPHMFLTLYFSLAAVIILLFRLIPKAIKDKYFDFDCGLDVFAMSIGWPLLLPGFLVIVEAVLLNRLGCWWMKIETNKEKGHY